MRDEASSKALIAGAGVAVPRAVTAPTLAGIGRTGGGLTAPLALKGLGFAHKTEAGAVRLGLTSLDGQAEMAGAQGYLAEEMVTGVVAELLVGLRRDPVYGATVTLGFGGVTAELLADTVTLVLPVTEDEVVAALAAACGSGRCSMAIAGGPRRRWRRRCGR
jgi:acetate---CoA ligase (ADP-forming)